MKIAVVGLGYVGLPLSLQFARSCTDVIGIDVDAKIKMRDRPETLHEALSDSFAHSGELNPRAFALL